MLSGGMSQEETAYPKVTPVFHITGEIAYASARLVWSVIYTALSISDVEQERDAPPQGWSLRHLKMY